MILKSDGSLNASAMARALGVSQPTISRALANPNYQPKKELIDAVCRVFGVSAAQARGEDTLVTGPDETRRFSPRTQRFAERFERLSPANKKIIEQIISNLEAVQDAARRAV